MINENFDSSIFLNEVLVNNNPYGFNLSESDKSNIFLGPINIDNSSIYELDEASDLSFNIKKNHLEPLLNFSTNKDPITGISIESFNQHTNKTLEESSLFQSISNYITIENKGNTHLSKDEEGFGYIKNSEEYIAIKSFSSNAGYGQHWGNKTWDDWEIVGAEKINDQNSTIWKKISGEFWVANHDADWAYEANSGSYKSGEQLLLCEKSFQQDFNSDGIIGGNIYTSTEAEGNVTLAKR